MLATLMPPPAASKKVVRRSDIAGGSCGMDGGARESEARHSRPGCTRPDGPRWPSVVTEDRDRGMSFDHRRPAPREADSGPAVRAPSHAERCRTLASQAKSATLST